MTDCIWIYFYKIFIPLEFLIIHFYHKFDLEIISSIRGIFYFIGTFVPRKEVEVIETVEAVVINTNQALKLRARAETKDRNGIDRVTGEEWIVKKTGAYLPGAYEEVVDLVEAIILTEKVQFFKFKAIITYVKKNFSPLENTNENQESFDNGTSCTRNAYRYKEWSLSIFYNILCYFFVQTL